MKKLALLIAVNCLFMAVSAQTTLTIPTFDGQVKVNYSKATESSSVHVIISDIYGNQRIACDYDAEGEAHIDINKLNSGVYIVSLYVDGTYVDSKRIMK